MSCFDASAQPYQQSTVFILNLDYLLCEIGYCCTLRKTRNAAHRWVDPHTIDSLFFVFPSDIWCKINKLLKYYEYQLTKRCFEERLDGFKVSLWFLGPSIWAPLTTIINLSISSAAVPEEWKYARVTVHFWVWYQKPWTEVVRELSYESMSICCLWQRTVCTSADKIWRPTRVHAWSHFAFNFYQWLAQLVYLSHRSYFMRTMLSFTTLTPVSETYISTVFNKDLKTVAVLDPL